VGKPNLLPASEIVLKMLSSAKCALKSILKPQKWEQR
jgi:hypothetical protein